MSRQQRICAPVLALHAVMANEPKEPLPPRDEAPPQADRDGRSGTDPGAQTNEYTNDMLVNRFTPPPPPDDDGKDS